MSFVPHAALPSHTVKHDSFRRHRDRHGHFLVLRFVGFMQGGYLFFPINTANSILHYSQVICAPKRGCSSFKGMEAPHIIHQSLTREYSRAVITPHKNDGKKQKSLRYTSHNRTVLTPTFHARPLRGGTNTFQKQSRHNLQNSLTSHSRTYNTNIKSHNP